MTNKTIHLRHSPQILDRLENTNKSLREHYRFCNIKWLELMDTVAPKYHHKYTETLDKRDQNSTDFTAAFSQLSSMLITMFCQ